ncbi:MAG TPA: maleylpyruvate isomerase N-terminal domain-containing protein [Panacibacter sp.]|nr:maleylpyruvate isomerase N-terminal domain-containing protein [Panacibacter sp.]
MPNADRKIPINTLHLFTKLDVLLIALLKSLSTDQWNQATIARQWTVKDIAAHLLDGNLRTLSFLRDKYFAAAAPVITSHESLVRYLNELNADWIIAANRLSPQVLIELLEITGKQFSDHLQTLKPFDTAMFSVAWAGQDKSENWFHIAREYTEKFIHQQQIRDAVDKPGILTKELFYPFMDTFMYGLPHTYRNVSATTGTVVQIKVITNIGGEWNLIKTEDNWQLSKTNNTKPTAIININPDTAWRLFSKGISPEEARKQVEILGDIQLGKVALQMVSVMA